MEVFDDEQHGLVGADGLGEGEHALEQRSLVGGKGLGVGGLAQHPLAGKQPQESRVAPGDVVEEIGQLAGDAAGDLGEGEVGKGAVGEVEAVTGDHEPAGLQRPVAQLGEEPGLADTRVAGEEHGRPLGRVGGVSGRRDAERGAEVLQLGISSDQLRCHVVHLVEDHRR